MNYRIETRLALIVSVLAIATVAVTAFAIRQGARSELSKASLFRTVTGQGTTATRVKAVADALAGHCCSPVAVAAGTAALRENEIALVYDAAADHPVARFERVPQRISRLDAKRSTGGVVLDSEIQGGVGVQKIRLSILGPGAPLQLADGRAGALYVFHIPLPDEGARTASFLLALDRRVLEIAAIAAALAVALTWITARRIFNPLRELDRALRDVSEGRLDRQVRVSGAGEVALLEQRFNAMAAELSRQQQLRRDLTSDVAHELRAPLTGLRCRLEALVDGLTASTPETLATLQEDLVHLSHLVDDLQDVALAEAREIRLQRATIPITPLLHSAVRAAGLEGDARLRLAATPDLEMCADEKRIRQVVVNLLTNADRYTPPDGNLFLCSRVENGEVVVEVRNTGSTLEPVHRERVFDRFYRTDPARQRSTGGSGLGLAIVKSLVEAHGGRVWATSGGEGVTFGFSIPLSHLPVGVIRPRRTPSA